MMKIRHRLTGVVTEISRVDWDDKYVGKKIDDLFEILKEDTVLLRQIDKKGNRTPYRKFDREHAINMVKRNPLDYDFIELSEEEKKTNNLSMVPVPPSKIQLTTRRNILDSFLVTRIAWYGRLDQTDFLGRLYDLQKLKSFDDRYQTAYEDINKHTFINFDWPDEWIFTDSRFNLLHSTDKEFLDFLCLTIHPTVRINDDEITALLEIYNNNLHRDGFEIEQTGKTGGRPTYGGKENKVDTISASAVSSKPIEKRIALVIGCGNYSYATPLVNPVNDANSMEKSLKALGFKVIKAIDPSQKDLKKIIDEFGEELKGYTIGLFYFAGHGVQVKGLNYLIPMDANLKTERMVEYDCVEAGRILAHMADARSSVNLLILDACRNNPFERSWGRGIGQRGLATMNAPKGSLIAYSTSPGSTASDGEGENGLYTAALLKNISAKAVPVNTMFQKVRLEVMEKSGEEQIPWEATSLTADFYFNN